MLAHLSGDERLAEAFRKGEDIHAWTAAAILGKKLEDVNADDRRLAKMVNYGLVYGMGDYGLSWRAEIPVAQARAFLDEYMLRFAGVARWREQVVEEAKQVGFVRTISGRIRPTPGIADRNRNVAEATKRYALNAPVQGSAADIIKLAMIRLEERLAGAGFGIGMISAGTRRAPVRGRDSEAGRGGRTGPGRDGAGLALVGATGCRGRYRQELGRGTLDEA